MSEPHWVPWGMKMAGFGLEVKANGVLEWRNKQIAPGIFVHSTSFRPFETGLDGVSGLQLRSGAA
jgi:hypothetical protein